MGAVGEAGAQAVAGTPFTAEELDQMPRDGRRYEVLDGTLVVSERPSALHQVLAARVAGLLLGTCPDCMFVHSRPVVRLSRTTAFAPDVTVSRHQQPGGTLTEPPLLIVEIGAPSTMPSGLDRRKAAYAAFGVRSYWIVVPDTRRPELTVFETTSGQYETVAHVAGGDAFRARQPFPVEVIPGLLVAGLRPAQRPRDGISVTA